MPREIPTLITASAMAKNLGVSEVKVKKAIKEWGLSPAAKRGCCTYYGAEEMVKLKALLK